MINFSYRWCTTEHDYDVVCEIMNMWGMPALDRKLLPEYGAIITSPGGIDVCSGWLYKTDSKIALIEWVVLNKNAKKQDRIGAVDFLYSVLAKQAKKLDYEIVTCILHSKQLERRLEKQEYISSNEVYTNILFKKV
jgi:hypothetical protein